MKKKNRHETVLYETTIYETAINETALFPKYFFKTIKKMKFAFLIIFLILKINCTKMHDTWAVLVY